MRRTGAPGKRKLGIHLSYTQAQTLDEALDIIKHRQRRHRLLPRTLNQEFASANRAANFRNISLSDRVVPHKWKKPAAPKAAPQPVLDKAAVLARAKNFSVPELARMAKVSKLQVYVWLHGSAWNPKTVTWTCKACKHKTNGASFCYGCGASWKQSL